MKTGPILKTLFSLTLFLSAISVNGQQITTEEIDLKNGEIQIPGTLSYPRGKNKVPLIIYVHGSGNVDRNGNQPGTTIKANYIKTLADSLNTKGIACYRYDKRTSTPSNIKLLKNTTLLDFVDDVKIAVRYFKKDARFNSVHLIGHSQGALVAMLSITETIDSYISLAGPSEPIDKILIAQLSKQNKSFGSVVEKHFKELKETDTIQKVNPYLGAIFSPPNQKFIAHWARLDPTEEIKKLPLPVLIVNGDSDLQVSTAHARKLHTANANSELQIIPKMNHVLKEVNTVAENQRSYTDESIAISKRLISVIVAFIEKNN